MNPVAQVVVKKEYIFAQVVVKKEYIFAQVVVKKKYIFAQVVVTSESARAVDQLRRACGGHGFMASSNLPCKWCIFFPV